MTIKKAFEVMSEKERWFYGIELLPLTDKIKLMDAWREKEIQKMIYDNKEKRSEKRMDKIRR